MHLIALLLLIFSVLSANISDIPDERSIAVKGKFAANRKCVRCHLDIYKEFKHSRHRHSSVVNNPLHRTMWEGNPLSKEKKGKYLCASCHAPAAENIDALMNGDAAIDMDDRSLDDGVGCAFCHRIADVHPTDKGDKYVISDRKRYYYGTRESRQKSDFHKIDTNNTLYRTGNLCLTCHAHHKKEKLLILQEEENATSRFCVFSHVDANVTKSAKNGEKENCITCHMPQVEGSFTDRFTTATHAYHGFDAIGRKMVDAGKYLDINISLEPDAIRVDLINRMPHALVLHPTRLFEMRVLLNGKLLEKIPFFKPYQNRKYKPLSWLNENIRYRENVQAKSHRRFRIEKRVRRGDRIDVQLGYYIINPEVARKVGFNDTKTGAFQVLVEKKYLSKEP